MLRLGGCLPTPYQNLWIRAWTGLLWTDLFWTWSITSGLLWTGLLRTWSITTGLLWTWSITTGLLWTWSITSGLLWTGLFWKGAGCPIHAILPHPVISLWRVLGGVCVWRHERSSKAPVSFLVTVKYDLIHSCIFPSRDRRLIWNSFVLRVCCSAQVVLNSITLQVT